MQYLTASNDVCLGIVKDTEARTGATITVASGSAIQVTGTDAQKSHACDNIWKRLVEVDLVE